MALPGLMAPYLRLNTAVQRFAPYCDRCRLKKAKCDGNSPCSRCVRDGTVCVASQRKLHGRDTPSLACPTVQPSVYRTESQVYQDELYNPSAFQENSSFYQAPPIDTWYGRGRTASRSPPLERRDSSASSVRSMIDDRMRWAHEERSKSRAASPTPPSPFRSGSPFAGEYNQRLNGYGDISWPNLPQQDASFSHGYMPSQAAISGGAHLAMKGFAIDHHSGQDFVFHPDCHPPRQSMSNNDTASPTTPHSGANDTMGPEFPAVLSFQDPPRPEPMSTSGTYSCTYHGCTQRFHSHLNLQKHKRDFYRSQPPTRDAELHNHSAGPHKCTRINPSIGKPCNTVFSRPYDLTRHEDTIHNNRKVKVRCPLCREEKTFTRNDALTRHMRSVHPEVESFGRRQKRTDTSAQLHVNTQLKPVSPIEAVPSSAESSFADVAPAAKDHQASLRRSIPGDAEEPVLVQTSDSGGGEVGSAAQMMNDCLESDRGTLSAKRRATSPLEATGASRRAQRTPEVFSPPENGSSHEDSTWRPGASTVETTRALQSVDERTLQVRLPSQSLDHSQTPRLVANELESATSRVSSSTRPKTAKHQRSGRSHACSICGKSFSRSTLRDNHMRTHSYEKPFVCSVEGCAEHFKQKNEQIRHEKTKHAPKRFVCGGVLPSGKAWGCGKAFARSDGLLEHQTQTKKGIRCSRGQEEG